MGFEDKQEAYLLAMRARSNQLNQGQVAGERNTLTDLQLQNALAELRRQQEADKWVQSQWNTAPGDAKKAAETAAAIERAKAEGDTLNGMPVKYLPGGGIAYDIEKIGADLGMSPEEIQGAYVNIGTRKLTPENALRNLGPGMDKYSGGAGDLEQQRRGQWDQGISSLSQNQAILNNIAEISPLENIDFTNKDVLANLAKPGFLTDRPGNVKSLVNQGQGPRGAGAWARYVVPALASIVIGAGAAGALGAFGSASTLTGGGTVAGSAGLSGGAINAMGSTAGLGTAGAGAAGAGGAINAIQSGALAAGAGGGANALAAGATTAATAAAGGASTVAGIPWDTIISVGGNLAGGVLGYIGAGNAADAVSKASDKSAEVAWQMYQQGRADLAPWREAGGAAVQDLAGKIAAGPGEFTESPGYQWTLAQGLNAQQNALSAMGANRSGKHIKAATDYAEGLASTEYDNFLKRWYQSLTPLQSMAGLGQTSAQQTANLGANAATNMGNAYQTGGMAQGAGTINQTNALTGAIQGGANSLLQYNALRNLPQAPYNPSYWGAGAGGAPI